MHRFLSLSHVAGAIKRRILPASRYEKPNPFFLPQEIPAWNCEGHFQQVEELYGRISNDFTYYQSVTDQLRRVASMDIVPVRELMAPSSQNRTRIAIRHDVDMDPRTALRCARYLSREGIPGSFYLLHTNPYYASYFGNNIMRTSELPEWVDGLIAAGVEVGLHTDGMNLYLNYGIDGIASVEREISWLRSRGAVVTGTVAHNSGPLYGAENYEIFAERVLWERELKDASGNPIPLGTLSFERVGIEYEGTFARRRENIDLVKAEKFFADKAASSVGSESWMRMFLLENPTSEFETTMQCWLLGPDIWLIVGIDNGRKIFGWHVSFNIVMEAVTSLSVGSKVLFVIHPEYVRG